MGDSAPVMVEVLYFDGCPSHEALVPHLHELLTSAGVDATVELRRIEGVAAAEAQHFLGSPTVLVNGEDVDPGARERTDFGLKCRLYATPDGIRGMPDDDWVLAALRRGRSRRPGERSAAPRCGRRDGPGDGLPPAPAG